MKKVFKAIGIVLLVIVALVVLCFVASLIGVFAGSHSEIQGDPQVMLIFGYKLDGEDMPSLLKSRLDSALGYLAEHPDMTVIVSGGKGDGESMSEAQRMYDYLTEQGVDGSQIIVEDKASTTAENIGFSLDLIKQNDIDISGGVLLVSNEFHLARIRMLWKRAGNPAVANTLAAPSEPTSQKALMHLREPFALIIDFLSAKF